MTWADADIAANNFYELMITRCGGTVPTYAWDVYLAFDTGECTPPGGDLVTRPILEALQSATRCLTIGSSDRGSRLRCAKEGVDD
jgi:hypothetical protein